MELPTPILDFSHSGLHMIVPKTFPFLRKLVEKVMATMTLDGTTLDQAS